MFILFQLFSDILSIYNLRLAIVFFHFSDANKKSLWVIMSGFFFKSDSTLATAPQLSIFDFSTLPNAFSYGQRDASYCHRDDEVIKVVI